MNRNIFSTAALLLVTACLPSCSTITQTHPFDCTTIIPETWSNPGVPGAALPTEEEVAQARQQAGNPVAAEVVTTRVWQSFGLAQSGQLSLANERTRDAVAICRNANRLLTQADARSNRKWWQFWR